MKIPSPITWDKYPNVAQWLNQLREAVAAGEIKPSPNYKVHRTTGGTKISVHAPRPGSSSGGGTPAAPAPFTITLTGGTAVTLWPGQCNQLVPSNMFTTFTYTPASTMYCYVRAPGNGRQVTSASIIFSGTGPSVTATTQGIAPTTFDALIGIITNNVVYQVKTGNIVASILQTHVEEKVTPVPGTSPITRWFSWSIIFS